MKDADRVQFRSRPAPCCESTGFARFVQLRSITGYLLIALRGKATPFPTGNIFVGVRRDPGVGKDYEEREKWGGAQKEKKTGGAKHQPRHKACGNKGRF